MTVAWITLWKSFISLSNSLYMELQCPKSLCCTVGVSSPIKELSIWCSVIKWFADLTLKTTLCWWELHFCPGGELLWELTCFCSCCGTLASLRACNLPVFLRLCLAKAHLSFTAHSLHLLNTPPSSRRGHSDQTQWLIWCFPSANRSPYPWSFLPALAALRNT